MRAIKQISKQLPPELLDIIFKDIGASARCVNKAALATINNYHSPEFLPPQKGPERTASLGSMVQRQTETKGNIERGVAKQQIYIIDADPTDASKRHFDAVSKKFTFWTRSGAVVCVDFAHADSSATILPSGSLPYPKEAVNGFATQSNLHAVSQKDNRSRSILTYDPGNLLRLWQHTDEERVTAKQSLALDPAMFTGATPFQGTLKLAADGLSVLYEHEDKTQAWYWITPPFCNTEIVHSRHIRYPNQTAKVSVSTQVMLSGTARVLTLQCLISKKESQTVANGDLREIYPFSPCGNFVVTRGIATQRFANGHLREIVVLTLHEVERTADEVPKLVYRQSSSGGPDRVLDTSWTYNRTSGWTFGSGELALCAMQFTALPRQRAAAFWGGSNLGADANGIRYRLRYVPGDRWGQLIRQLEEGLDRQTKMHKKFCQYFENRIFAGSFGPLVWSNDATAVMRHVASAGKQIKIERVDFYSVPEVPLLRLAPERIAKAFTTLKAESKALVRGTIDIFEFVYGTSAPDDGLVLLSVCGFGATFIFGFARASLVYGPLVGLAAGFCAVASAGYLTAASRIVLKELFRPLRTDPILFA